MNAFHIKAVVEAKAKNGGSVKIGDDWYSSFKGAGLQGVEKGTLIEFDWAPDKTGKWKNIDSKSIVVHASAPPPASSGASGGAYVPKSNIGMELGHAAKLAMDFTLAQDRSDLDYWEENTIDIYQRMKRLRTAAEAGFPDVQTPADDDEPSPF